MKIEVGNNDKTEHPHDDKPSPYLCTVCDKRFTRKQNLTRHKQIVHSREKLSSCSQGEQCFNSLSYLTSHVNIHSSKYKCTECGKCCRSCLIAVGYIEVLAHWLESVQTSIIASFVCNDIMLYKQKSQRVAETQKRAFHYYSPGVVRCSHTAARHVRCRRCCMDRCCCCVYCIWQCAD